MNLLKFEFLACWKNRNVIIFVSLGFVLILCLFLFNLFILKNEQVVTDDGMKENLYRNQKELDNSTSGMPNKEKDFVLQFYNEENDYYNDFRFENTLSFLRGENDYLKNYELLQVIDSNDGEENTAYDLPASFILNKKILNNELIRKKYKPMSVRFGITGIQFTNFFLYGITSFVGIFFLLLLFGDILGNDIENKKSRFILTQPIQRRNYFFTMSFISFTNMFLLTLILCLFSFLLGSIFSKMGNLDYPMLLSSPYGTKTMLIPIWKYWFFTLMLFFFTLFFLTVLNSFISILVKNSQLSILLTMGLAISGNKVSTLKPFQSVSHLNPFAYLEPTKIFIGTDFQKATVENFGYSVSGGDSFAYIKSVFILENKSYYFGGNLATLLNNENINLVLGICILFINSVILFLVGNVYFFKKATLN